MGFLYDNFIADFFRWVIDAFYGVFGNYVVAALLAALVSRLLILPLDIRQRRNSRKTAMLSGEVESIRKRYANAAPNEVQLRIQKLYKENGVGTMSGCLPLLIQFPLLLAFFGALSSIANREILSTILRAAETGGQSVELAGFLWVHNIWQPDTGSAGVLPNASDFLSFIQRNASTITPQALQLLQNKGILSYSSGALSVNTQLYNMLTDSIISSNGLSSVNNGWFGLPALAAGTQFLQQWLTSRKAAANPGAAADPNAQASGMMKYIMPVLTFIFTMSSNAVFGLYWTFTNVYAIAVEYIFNYFYDRKQKRLQPKA